MPRTHEFHMRRAIELARRGWGQTHPGPLIGALIVDRDFVLAEAWQRAAGQPHPSVQVIQAFQRKPSNETTLYLSLEPFGDEEAGGCALLEAIQQSGISRVVMGATAPRPGDAGKGAERLRERGIDVTEGVLREQCTDLNLIFNHWIKTGTPLIAGKMALTLDGKFAAASGDSKWITGESARADVMKWRRYFPAIAVGAETVLHDDPSLTSRTAEGVFCPRRFVFDRHLKTLKSSPRPALYRDEFASRTVVLCLDSADPKLRIEALDAGLHIWGLPEEGGYMEWSAFKKRASEEGICGVFIETGARLATALLESRKLDYLFVYKASKFLSDREARGMGSDRKTDTMNQCLSLQSVRHEIFGGDSLTRGWLEK